MLHLFGHQHTDTFKALKDIKNLTAIGTLQIPGSVNPNGNKNPTFRIYELDYETRYPVRSHKHFFNLTAANSGNPKWEYMHEVTKEYDMPDFSPKSFIDLSNRIKSNVTIATKYLRSKH